MKKELIILIVVLMFGAKVHAQTNQNNNSKPNILFIAVDDLKPELGCYGNNLIRTPHIDRLAAKGMVFERIYCQQAICGPTRASLMTGKRPDYTKVWDLKTKMRDVNPDILSIPQYFSQNGYTTAGIGKIYDPRCVDKDQDKQSWSIPYYNIPAKYFYNNQPAILNNYQNPETRKKAQKYLDEATAKGLDKYDAREYALKYVRPSVENEDLPDNAYDDGAMVTIATEILAYLAKDKKPFFFGIGFTRPHLPFVAPKKYWDMYNRDKMPLAKFQEHAKNSPDLAYHNSGELRTYTDIPPLLSFTDLKGNGTGLPIEKQKELIHGYYAAISFIDAQIGKLVESLDSLGLTENTIIVLWGDHGWHLGDHGLWCKHTNFENATRSPLILYAPGFKPGKSKSLAEFVDIFPTLSELSGLTIPENLDGKSLVPLIKNPKASVKRYAVSQYPRGGSMGYSIRTEKYRFTMWMKNEFRSNKPFSMDLILARELYDYKKDPLETINVVNDKRYNKISQELEGIIVEYFKDQQASMK